MVLPNGKVLEENEGERLLKVDEVRARGIPVLRVGVVNVMPQAESYEPYLLRPMARAPVLVEPVWIRLESHHYRSSSPAHIQQHYRTFAQVLGEGALSGLILTGAPVEELDFEAVHYWPELSRILDFSRRNLRGTLGLCWGGLALAKLLGLDKLVFRKKLFGVFRNRNLDSEHAITGDFDDAFFCAHSRHSGIKDGELEAARDAGLIRLLSHGPETGYSIFESSDRRFLMHLGHPEYEAERLVLEWRRDQELGRADVERPVNFDPDQPINVWRSHRNELFSRWLGFLSS